MKKWLLRIFLGLTLLLVAGLTAGYFYGRAHLHELPALVKSELAKQGIKLDFQGVETPKTGLKVTLSGVTVSGPAIPYDIQAKSVMMGVELAFWPPLLVLFSAESPVLAKNSQYKSAPPVAKPGAPAEPPPATLGYLLALAQFELALNHAELAEFGVHDLTLSVRVKGLGLGPNGLEKASVRHDLELARLDQAPWLPGLRWSGPSFFEYPKIRTGEHDLIVGPLVMQALGNFDLKTQKWAGQVTIPQTKLTAGSSILSAAASQHVKSLHGELALKASAQGIGPDPAAMNAEGVLRAKGLKMVLSHPKLKGSLTANIDGSFKKSKALTVNAVADADLTKAEVSHENAFLKPEGVPLTLAATVAGNEGQLTISRGEARFHNLVIALGGTLQIASVPGNSTGNLTARIAPTNLAGWERFFPKYSNIKTQGTLAGDLAFSGPLQNWQAARIDLALKADNVRVPVLKEWIPSKDFAIDGVTALNSDTKVVYSQGSLKTLQSVTQIDMRESSVAYGEFFQKARGVPMSADVALVSTANRADIKRGNIILGSIRGSLKGSVNNFANPISNLHLETGLINVKELQTLSPAAKMKTISNLNGAFNLKASVTGPLVAKGIVPQVKGEAGLSNVTLQYEMESKKKIQVNSLSGPIAFTTNSVSGRNVQAAFPNTAGTLDFSIVGFTKPDITFSLTASRFTLKDFYESATGDSSAKTPGMTAIPVIAAGPSSQATAKGAQAAAQEDFRKNPYLRNSRVVGAFNLRQADLGSVKAESMSGKIDYDKLVLKLDPFQIRLYNGVLTYTTEWNGRPEVPQTKMSLKVEKVDANQFLSAFSDKVKDLIFGSLNTDMALGFQGMTSDQIMQTTRGGGTFNLADGGFKTVRLSKQPLEALKKLPGLGSAITKTDWDEKLTAVRGSYKIEGGKLRLSDIVMLSPQFDAVASDTTFDYNGNVESKVTWTPKEGLIPANLVDAIRDPAGKASLPLVVKGPLSSPSVSLDQSIIETRLKAYAGRKLEEEKSKVSQQLKSKVEDEVKKRLGDKLKGIFQ